MKLKFDLFAAALLLAVVYNVSAPCPPPTPTSYCVHLSSFPRYGSVANHFATAGWDTLFGGPPPVDMEVYKVTGGGFVPYYWSPADGFWDPSEPVLGNGEGAFVRWSYGTVDLNASGASPVPSPLTLAAGKYLLGRQEVGLGTFESIVGVPPGNCSGAKVGRLFSGATVVNAGFPLRLYIFKNGRWSPEAPICNVGEGAFIIVPSGCSGGALPPFGATGITPAAGQECNSSFLLKVTGNGFAAGDVVKLGNGTIESAATTTTPSSTLNSANYVLEATFDLGAAKAALGGNGLFNVLVYQGGNPTPVILANAFNLKACGSGVEVRLVGRDIVGLNSYNTYFFCVENQSGGAIGSLDVSVTGIPPTVQVDLTSIPSATTIPSGFKVTLSLASGQKTCLAFGLTAATASGANLGDTYTLTCSTPTPYVDSDQIGVTVAASQDPNDKIGPEGSGTQHFITGAAPSDYQITFENKPTATAPAQKVRITDQLNVDKLDVGTFSLGPITFGHKLVTPPPGAISFSADVPYDVDGNPATTADNIIVRINATLTNIIDDPNFGEVVWEFQTIDPATGNPPANPLIGFLPPNIIAPQGQGTVSFTVSPQSYLVSGDTIGNQANIVFDANAAIATPMWVNTIDKTHPYSPKLGITLANGVATISWAGPGRLQRALGLPAQPGDWQDVAGATSPYAYTVSALPVSAFYRVRQ